MIVSIIDSLKIYPHLVRRHMAKQSNLGGTFTFTKTAMTVKRMGYGAMQLAGRDGNKMV